MSNQQAIEVFKEMIKNVDECRELSGPSEHAGYIYGLEQAILFLQSPQEPSRYQIAKEVLNEFCGGDTFEFASHEIYNFEKWLEEKQLVEERQKS